jgi:protein-disulfide isomerase
LASWLLGSPVADAFRHVIQEDALPDLDLSTSSGFHGRVAEDFHSGVRSGVNGTPTFFINGIRYDGSRDVESMITALRA